MIMRVLYLRSLTNHRLHVTSLNFSIPNQVTEDMSRQKRHAWCELQRFMFRVMDRYPHSQYKLSSDSLLVDGRVFVWDKMSGKVEEQVTAIIPVQGEIVTSAAATTRYFKNMNILMMFFFYSGRLPKYK